MLRTGKLEWKRNNEVWFLSLPFLYITFCSPTQTEKFQALDELPVVYKYSCSLLTLVIVLLGIGSFPPSFLPPCVSCLSLSLVCLSCCRAGWTSCPLLIVSANSSWLHTCSSSVSQELTWQQAVFKHQLKYTTVVAILIPEIQMGFFATCFSCFFWSCCWLVTFFSPVDLCLRPSGTLCRLCVGKM